MNVERHKWKPSHPLMYLDSKALNFESLMVDNVCPEETVKIHGDDEESPQSACWTTDDFRAFFFLSVFPTSNLNLKKQKGDPGSVC